MRPLLFFLFWISILSLIGGLISCKDTQINSSTEIVFPVSNVSFSKHVGPLFQQKCTSSPCHGGDTPASGLNLEYPSYTSLINHVPTLIVPYDTNCVLLKRLEGLLPQMPPPNLSSSRQLTGNQITGIKKWIEEGTQYN